MKNIKRLTCFAIFVFVLIFSGGCKKEAEKKLDTPEERLKYENAMKAVAENANFIVSLKTRPHYVPAPYFNEYILAPTLTAFFVDKRGYVLSARHGYEGSSIASKVPEIVFPDGKTERARIVGEIQTLDLMLLSIDKEVDFSVAKFADLSETFESGKFYAAGELNMSERLVVMRCINNTKPIDTERIFSLDRVLIGEFTNWDRETKTVRFEQKQQDAPGCSGAPVLNIGGEVVGVLRTSFGDGNNAVDADSARGAVEALIEEDLKKQSGQK